MKDKWIRLRIKKGEILEEFYKSRDWRYLGDLASTETSEIILHGVVLIEDSFYKVKAIFAASLDEHDCVWLEKVEGFKESEWKAVSECPIKVALWDEDLDDETPICLYAFSLSEKEKAKELVKDWNFKYPGILGVPAVTILINGDSLDVEEFLNS